jgi:transcriptional regulator with XRE-family HTH domain
VDTLSERPVMEQPLRVALAEPPDEIQNGADGMAAAARFSRAPTNADAVIGRRIRELRRASGMTLKDLALRVRVTSVQLHRYETGATRVAASRLLCIAEALRVRPEQIVGATAAHDEREPADRLGDEVAELVRVFSGIKDQRHRAALVSLARSMSEAERALP